MIRAKTVSPEAALFYKRIYALVERHVSVLQTLYPSYDFFVEGWPATTESGFRIEITIMPDALPTSEHAELLAHFEETGMQGENRVDVWWNPDFKALAGGPDGLMVTLEGELPLGSVRFWKS